MTERPQEDHAVVLRLVLRQSVYAQRLVGGVFARALGEPVDLEEPTRLLVETGEALLHGGYALLESGPSVARVRVAAPASEDIRWAFEDLHNAVDTLVRLTRGGEAPRALLAQAEAVHSSTCRAERVLVRGSSEGAPAAVVGVRTQVNDLHEAIERLSRRSRALGQLVGGPG